MGVGAGKLYVTRIDSSEDLFLSEWKPEFRGDGYYRPKNTPLGLELTIPNLLPDLKFGDDPVNVVLEECNEEDTGLYIAAANGYFSNEIWLYVKEKPTLKEIGKSIKIKHWDYGLGQLPGHVSDAVCKTDLKSYEGIRNVKLKKSH